jgi:benzoyl-CoA reductase/2-hydroxyglutaryl-CoA dehydratase subunit BcrC/BadD/HgdB
VFVTKGPTFQRLRIDAAKKLLRSRSAWRLARMVARRRAGKAHDRVAWDFFLGLGNGLYAGGTMPVVWSSIFVPCELLWGMGLLPFYPETAAGIAAGFGLSGLSLTEADAAGYPVDLCSFNRSAAGLRAAGFYPRADFYVASSSLCDVTGQLLANFAHAEGRPFFLLDVPQSQDRAAEDYLHGQLQALTARWREELGVDWNPERMGQALHYSNQARELALEVARLREADPAPLRGSSMLGQLGMLTTMFGHPRGVDYYRALRDYTRERVQRGEPEQQNQQLRLYWMHLRPYYTAELMPHLEDDLGGVIACEETGGVWWDALDEATPLRSLARKASSMFLNGPVERRAKVSLDRITRYRCVGAIHFSHWGCRQSTGGLRVLRDLLRRQGIPLLVLDGDCVDPINLQPGPLRTRVEAFVEMLLE